MARMSFIPALEAMIRKNLVEKQGVSDSTVTLALAQWYANAEPRTPWERGCFEVFTQVQKQIEKGDEQQLTRNIRKGKV